MNHPIKFLLNNTLVEYRENPAVVLLDFIRHHKLLTGTKEVCKEGDCGACAIIMGSLKGESIEYKLINSCLYPLGNVNGAHIVTIEGLNKNGFTPIQQFFIDEGASQCGFCTPGFVVALSSYFISEDEYCVEDAIDALGGNICRCTGYMSIKRSIENAISFVQNEWDDSLSRIDNLIELKFIPKYFSNVANSLSRLILDKQFIRNNDDDLKIVSGGTDLYVQQPDALLENEILFPNQLENDLIVETENEIIIGGQVTFEELNRSSIINKIFTSINDYMFLIASLPIRNSATLAGNLVNASPIGDMTIFFLALNSRLLLAGTNEHREVNLKDFYLGYKSLDKANDELVKEIKFLKPTNEFRFNFEKVSKRINLDIASVNSAISLNAYKGKIINGHIAVGGVAPVPLYLENTSSLLNDSPIGNDLVDSLIESAQAEISPISDIRGSEEYKRLLVTQMVRKHFLTLFPTLVSEEVLS